MKALRFVARSAAYTYFRLCRQHWLLAGLALVCLLLTGMLGSAARQVLTTGVDFSGIVLAVSSPNDDGTLEMVEQAVEKMRDISRYCTLRVMDNAEARQALARGEVTALLELPEDFVGGILNGTNPDVRLIVDEDRPLEALLTQWVGQSAVDLLSAVQAGIYATIDSYDAAPVDGLSRGEMIGAINLRYINWALNRQDLYEELEVTATEVLPVELHYSLSLFVWLVLALSPMLYPVFAPQRLAARQRLRCIGVGSLPGYGADLLACFALLLTLLTLPAAMLLDWRLLPALGVAAALAAVATVLGSFLCLATGSAARCGSLVFLLGLAALALAGGILPPVLLPQSIRQLSWLSPVTWLRELCAGAWGYEPQRRCAVALAITCALCMAGGLWLYRRRMSAGEVPE